MSKACEINRRHPELRCCISGGSVEKALIRSLEHSLMSAHRGLSFILKAHFATKDQTGLIPSRHLNKRVPKWKSKMKRNKENKPSGHMKKRRAQPATHGCLPRSAPYLIAMSGRSVALFIPLRSSDCMLWLLKGGATQF